MSTLLSKNQKILFQGDSITDCNRKRLCYKDLGKGYVNFINHYLDTHLSNLSITCLNRGISGDRVIDLKNRWKESTLDLSPDILSILVGINDTWRRYDRNLTVSPDQFYTNYQYLLKQTLTNNPNTKIILMSPFLLPNTVNQIEWFEDLEPKIDIVKQLSKEFDTRYLPLQDIFNNNITPKTPNCYWSADGVHPTLDGHALIAKEWLKLITI